MEQHSQAIKDLKEAAKKATDPAVKAAIEKKIQQINKPITK